MSSGQGTSNTQVVKLRFTLHRASHLPDSRRGLSNYFVTLKTSADWTDRTDRRRGKNPEWNKEFLCDAKVSSPSLSIEVFRIGVTNQQPKLVAIASLDVAGCLHPSSTDILDERCPLLSPTDYTLLGKANIFYSCTLYHDGRAVSELTPSALHKLVQEEVAISEMTTPGDAGLATAVSFASSDVTQSIINILRKIDQVGQVITEVHPYAKLAWTVLNAAQRALAEQMDRDDRVRRLWNKVGDILDLVDPLGKYKDHRLYKRVVEAILKQVYECVLFLRWYADKGFGGRFARDTLSDKAKSAIENFEKAFQDLWQTLRDGLSVDHIMQTYRLVAATERSVDIAENEHLDRLPGAALFSVEYDKQKACLPGTRRKLLEDIEEWIHACGDGPERILWLSGPVGTGKSSVANSVAERMDSLGRLAASFRFDRDQADRTPAVLIGNLCRQVARFDDSLKGAILDAMKQHGPGGSMPCSSQATKLFIRPISKTEIIGPIVIIIDALDESGNDEPVTGGTSREDLVRTIVEEFIHLPASVKLLITSREEGCITSLMSERQLCKRLLISETSGVEADIKSFIEARIRDIRKSKRCKPDWPGPEKVQALTQHADGLFIWAAVACNFIDKGYNPDSQMKQVLDPSGPQQLTALDRLYMTVLEQSLEGIPKGGLEMCNWQRVVGTLSAVRTPLTVVEMDALLGLPTGSLCTTADFIKSLLPLLRVDAEMKTEVQLLHKSVFDFLTTQKRIPIDIAVQHRALAVDCLAYMNNNLSYG